MNNGITVFTKRLLDFMFYGGIIVMIAIPYILHLYGRYNVFFAEHYVYLVVIFMVSGVFAILIVRELRLVFHTVLNDDCFIMENVNSLKRMGTYSFFIAITTALRCYVYLSPAVLVTILVFMVAGLFSKVLSQVFDKAVTYKLENDLTI